MILSDLGLGKCSMCFEMTKSSTIEKNVQIEYNNMLCLWINLVKIFIFLMGRFFSKFSVGWN